MYTAKLRNQYGVMLELTHNSNYTITEITGLNPVSAAINTAALATTDGTMFNSSRKNERNIVITVVIESDVEKNRLALYRIAPPKYPVRFYFKNGMRDVFIDGYVETHEINQFKNRQVAQISIICPQPFFKSIEDNLIEFSSVEPLFEFEFWTEDESNSGEGIPFSEIITENEQTIVNNGDVESGLILELHALGTVENPVIYNRETRETFALNFTMQEADTITINTNPGEKSVTLMRDGIITNIINYIDIRNDWFVLKYGDNIFTYDATGGYEFLQMKILIIDKFEGV